MGINSTNRSQDPDKLPVRKPALILMYPELLRSTFPKTHTKSWRSKFQKSSPEGNPAETLTRSEAVKPKRRSATVNKCDAKAIKVCYKK